MVFSDEIGKGLGYLLNNCLHQEIENICMPGASFADITNKMLQMSFTESTTVVLLLSNSSGLDKKGLISFITSCANLNLHRCIIGTIPYIKSQNNYNNSIYNYNTMLFNLIQRHSDKLSTFDMNVLNNFIFNKGTLYLSSFCRKQLAKLLAKNIYDPVLHCMPGNISVRNIPVSNNNNKSPNLN